MDLLVTTSIFVQLNLQQLTSQVQVLMGRVGNPRAKSNIVTPKSLDTLATHNALVPWSSIVQSPRRQLHCTNETRQNDIHESPLRSHLCHCDIHAQNRYSERTPPTYRGMDISYCSCYSMPNSLGSQEPNKQWNKRQFVLEHTQENVYIPHQVRGSLLSKWVLSTWLLKEYISIKK
jgi:hypothetical protein